jgi:PAS domain S-box-containing protein
MQMIAGVAPNAAGGLESIQALLDTLEVIVVKLYLDGRIADVNRARERLSGFTSTDLRSRHICDAFTLPQESSQLQTHVARITDIEFDPHRHRES